jgi:hypothetical protein
MYCDWHSWLTSSFDTHLDAIIYLVTPRAAGISTGMLLARHRTYFSIISRITASAARHILCCSPLLHAYAPLPRIHPRAAGRAARLADDVPAAAPKAQSLRRDGRLPRLPRGPPLPPRGVAQPARRHRRHRRHRRRRRRAAAAGADAGLRRGVCRGPPPPPPHARSRRRLPRKLAAAAAAAAAAQPGLNAALAPGGGPLGRGFNPNVAPGPAMLCRADISGLAVCLCFLVCRCLCRCSTVGVSVSVQVCL